MPTVKLTDQEWRLASEQLAKEELELSKLRGTLDSEKAEWGERSKELKSQIDAREEIVGKLAREVDTREREVDPQGELFEAAGAPPDPGEEATTGDEDAEPPPARGRKGRRKNPAGLRTVTAFVVALFGAAAVYAQTPPQTPPDDGTSSTGVLVKTEPAKIAAPVSPTDAPTFLGVYTWQQAVWQYLETEPGSGEYTVSRGDFFGGRLVGGLGLGRFGFEGRVDVAGLKEQFAVDNPETYTTLEAYGLVHWVAFARQGVQVGPFLAGGSVSSKQSAGGINFDLWGAGVRLAGYGSELHVLYAKHDYLPLGGFRVTIAAHVRLAGPLAAVGDLVSGQDGYARAGIAVCVKGCS